MNHPAATFELQGSARAALAELERDIAAGRLAHGLLLAGPEGIGKATLAYALARKLLGDDEQTLSRILAGSHADLLVIERAYDEKKEEFAKDISVEQTRTVAEFLALKAGEGAWRVVIVDGADSMNLNAANALLKILEEPPPRAVIILVAHQASRLLPTIRSRCRLCKIAPLLSRDFASILRRNQPEIGHETAERLGKITDYSPGAALALYEQEALNLLDQLELIFATLPALSHERILAMAEQISSGKQHQNWRIFTRLVLYLLSENARNEASGFWAEKWRETAEQFALVEARHLDYKSAVITFFHSLASKAAA